MPHWLVIAILFALGACVGSFLNVVVYRLPRVVIPAGATLATEAWLTLRGLSTPPSHCPRCNTQLRWKDNIPVFGWLLLGGRCRYCREPISARYPTIEFVTGLLFAGTYVLMF
ncbi:prepilin peptidase, partial [bacterium]